MKTDDNSTEIGPNKVKRTPTLSCRVWPLAMFVLLIGNFAPTVVMAVPVNPQRPFEATDCEGAKARLHEALLGSPLISPEEMAEVLAIARLETQRLCGSDVTQEIIAKFNAANSKNSK